MLQVNRRAFGSFLFTGVFNEYDLILSRAAVFQRPNDVDAWTICALRSSDELSGPRKAEVRATKLILPPFV